jgi:hypothetical protein
MFVTHHEWMKELEIIYSKLDRILVLQEKIMATEQDLQTSIAGIQTAVATVATELTTLITDFNTAITGLQAQIAAGGPVSQAQLEDLKAQADTILTNVQALGTAVVSEDSTFVPTPTPPVTPPEPQPPVVNPASEQFKR